MESAQTENLFKLVRAGNKRKKAQADNIRIKTGNKTKMRIEELKKSLAEKVYPAYIIDGDDAYLRELAVKQIKQKCLGDNDIDFCVFDGATVKNDPDSLVSALMQYPFLSEKRIVLVRDYAPTAADLKNKGLSAYFANPSDTSVLITVNVTPCENLRKIACAERVDCSKASPAVVARYVTVTLKRQGIAVSEENARILGEYCLFDMTRVYGETEKLAAYCYGKTEATKADIDAVVIRDTDYRIYEMTEKLAQKNADGALEILNDMLSKNADPQKLFTSVYYYFRRLFFCAVSNKSYAELSKDLGIKEYAAQKSVAQAKKIGARKLKNVITAFENCDAGFKSGLISPDNALFVCVFKILID